MIDLVLALAYALFVWWFSTGVIFFLNNRRRESFRWSLLGATVVLVAAFAGVWASTSMPSTAGAYIGFTCGLLIWGWQTLTYYMGYVTGPRKRACPPSCRGWRHFGHAVETSLYHELTILVTAVLLAAICLGTANPLGFWTFVVLWAMHVSAKLNVFLGVRNLNEEFLPEHLTYLKGFLTKRPINLLFPVSVTAGTVTTVLVADGALAQGADAFSATALMLLASLLALGVIEHWFMVLPLPAGSLWQWSLRNRAETDAPAAAGAPPVTADQTSETAVAGVRASEDDADGRRSGGYETRAATGLAQSGSGPR